MKTNSNSLQKSLDVEQQRKLYEFNEINVETRPTLKSEKWHTFAYTVIICFIQVAFGTSTSAIGPALVDLKHILKTSMKEIAMITLFLTIVGFLYKYINRQMTLIVLIVMTSISSALIPYSRNIWQLYICIFINGLGLGVWTNGKTVWLIEMWKQRSTPVLQLSGFMYGIGTFIGPIVIRPYLTGDNKIYVSALENINQTSHEMTLNASYAELSTTANRSSFYDQNSDEILIDRRGKLKTPFLISGSIHIIGMIFLMAMLFIKKYKTTKVENSKLNEKKLLNDGKTPKTLILGLIAMFGAFICVSEEIYLQFSATYYQYIPLKLTARESAEIVSVMALIYTIGRGMNFFVAIKLKPQLMIAFHSIIIYVSMAILFFGQNSITILWTGSLLMSFGFAPVYPLVFGLAGLYLDVTNKIGTIIMLSTDSLNIFMPFVFGRFIEKSPRVFIWSIVICVSMSTLIFICIIYTVSKVKKLNTKSQPSIT